MVFLNRAIDAGPSCAWAWSLNSLTCQYLGHTETPSPAPNSPCAFRRSALMLSGMSMFSPKRIMCGGNYADAVSWGRLSAAHNGGNLSNLRTLIASLVAAGETDEAREVARRVLRLDPEFHLAEFRARTPLQRRSSRALSSSV